PRALRTTVAEGATIDASALASGDGGKVIVWADDTTRFAGTLGARGGAQGGDGGFVEVSGKKTLDYAGKVNAAAPKGKGGTLLLDPETFGYSAVGDTEAGNLSATLAAGTD